MSDTPASFTDMQALRLKALEAAARLYEGRAAGSTVASTVIATAKQFESYIREGGV